MELLKYLKKNYKVINRLDIFRLIHGLKTAFGCLIGLSLAYYFNWPSGVWVPITIMVVMSAQTHFGGALKKAYMRFFGTLAGVSITLLVLTYFGNNEVAVFITIFLACMFFTYIASGGGNISYAGTLGGVTVLLTLTNPDANWHFAIHRGLYIVVGIIIALLVSRLVFPIHARDRLRIGIAKSLRDLRKLYSKTLEPDNKDKELFVIDEKLDSLILSNFEDQPILIEEAAAGSRKFRTCNKACYVEIVKIERKVYRLIYFMRMILQQDNWLYKLMHNIHGVHELNSFITDGLEELAKCIETKCQMELNIEFEIAIDKIVSIIKKMPHEKNMQKLLDEHSVLFFLEQIAREVKSLQKLVLQIIL